MGSTRLPGKVLKKVLGKSLLEFQVERIRRSKLINEIVIATTTKDDDEPIINLCNELLLKYYRGPEDDVLTRYYKAAELFHADIIVRITSDCPLIAPAIIDQCVKYYLENTENYDYITNMQNASYPRGMDVEVLPFKVLEKAFIEAKLSFEREHVTPYIYNHPEIFRIGSIEYKEDISQYRLTVDTIEDFMLIKQLLEIIYPNCPNFTLENILDVLRENPELPMINQHVQQKNDDVSLLSKPDE